MKRQLSPDTGLLLILLVPVVVASPSDGQRVTLSHVSTLYLPAYAADGSLVKIYDSGTVEQLALQPQAKLIYGVGNGVIHIMDASDVKNLTLKKSVRVIDGDMTDVEVCGEGVFVTYQNTTDKRYGGLRVYRTYNADTGKLELLHDIPMGSLPDMLKPTKDCTIVVAIENEGFVQGGQFYDPPGGVGIVRFPSGISGEPDVKIVNFTKFDSQFEQLSASGVRWVFREGGNNFSDNVEPEYVAFSHDYSKAYICLQENNAIAVLDMATDNVTHIYGLGFKQWGDLDPSDRDGGINIAEWPVFGMYQPDSVDMVHWDGQDYLITANEGDAQEYSAPVSFSEEIRGKDIADADIADSVSDDLKRALKNDTQLGRLTLSKVDGKNSQGKYEKFFTFGGRGFSIWRASDMVQVFDSGSEIEKELVRTRPDIFNSNARGDDLLKDSVDTRSDNKGPETESVAAGVVKNNLLVFIGNERPGTIGVYRIPPNSMNPEFQTLYAGGIPRDDTRTWSQVYEDRELYGIDPEYVEFVSASDGLADFPMLLVAGSVSGTVSLLKVEFPVDPSSKACPTVNPGVLVLLLCCLLSLCAWRHIQH